MVNGLTGVKMVCASFDHTLALKNDGTVWGWGNGGAGQLGNGIQGNREEPTLAIGNLEGKFVTAIAAGELHSLAMDIDGKAYAWGSDSSEQLGMGLGSQSTLFPTVISGLTNVTTIAAGKRYSFAIGTYNSAHRAFGWGSNNDGQLGMGSISGTPKNVPTGVAILNTIAVPPSQLDGGFQHSLALSGSTVYAWGDNDDISETFENWDNSGVFGDGGTTDKAWPVVSFIGDPAMAVSAGNNYSLVLLADGRVKSSGVNSGAQLGTNEVDTTGLANYTATPVFVEDSGDTGRFTSKHFYTYRPILSGQPADATTFTTATVSVCASAVQNPLPNGEPSFCRGIIYYKYSIDNGATWSETTSIATPITLSGLTAPRTVNLWVKGMDTNGNEIQTDTSAVKVSWTVN